MKGDDVERRPARRRRASPAMIVALLAVVASACSDPYAEVRAALSPGDRERFDRGARAAASCAACHDFVGRAAKIGPPLEAIEGRRAGSVPGFGYSEAMRSSNLIWDARTLDAFLADPQRVVPGNRMVAPGVHDPGMRRDLVFFALRARA